MHKYISAVILAALASTAMAQGKWEVGAAGGWGMGQAKETLIVIQPAVPSRDGYKYTPKGNGAVAGLSLGYSKLQNQNTFGLTIGAYKDFYTVRHSGPKRNFISGGTATFTKDLKRKYTLELAGKIGRKLNADTHLYAKLGLLRSQFVEQYKDTVANPDVDIHKNLKGWGGVAGIGVQKEFEVIKVGIEYDYHYYERIGSRMNYSSTGFGTKNSSKIRPQYHNVFLTISKSF